MRKLRSQCLEVCEPCEKVGPPRADDSGGEERGGGRGRGGQDELPRLRDDPPRGAAGDRASFFAASEDARALEAHRGSK